jgi:hypothetical protein
MTPDLMRLIAQIVVAAAWALCHLRLLLRTLTTKRRVHVAVRVLSLLPPATPIAALIAGQRTFPVVWFALAATYAVLRMQS